jgi:hypothetical protein
MQFIAFLLFVVYVFGIWKFLAGINRTNFTQGKIPLALLWPVLIIVNESYRRNFTKALTGS